MGKNINVPRKVCSLLIIWALLFQQTGFAQTSAQMDLSGYLTGLKNNFAQDVFRPAHLRYFSYDNLTDNFKLLVDKGYSGNGTAQGPSPTDDKLKQEARELLKYFLTGVSLPDDIFWVNLRPGSQDQIIDNWLEKTDVGKIMLEADVQLKKDTAMWTSPETAIGRKYWDKLYKKAEELYGYDNVTIPTLTRPWIVPGEIIVRESKDSAYVYKAVLKVMLEEDYLKVDSSQKSVGSGVNYEFKDLRAKELNVYSTQLIREMIIPKLTKEVNSSKKYAALRQVYYSLILSRWFKHRFGDESHSPQSMDKKGAYVKLINSNNLTGLTSKTSWSKETYYKQYQKSFAEGEYNIKEPVSTPTGQVIRSYFSGGIYVRLEKAPTTVFTGGPISSAVLSQPETIMFEVSSAGLLQLRPANVEEEGINLYTEGKVSSGVESVTHLEKYYIGPAIKESRSIFMTPRSKVEGLLNKSLNDRIRDYVKYQVESYSYNRQVLREGKKVKGWLSEEQQADLVEELMVVYGLIQESIEQITASDIDEVLQDAEYKDMKTALDNIQKRMSLYEIVFVIERPKEDISLPGIILLGQYMYVPWREFQEEADGLNNSEKARIFLGIAPKDSKGIKKINVSQESFEVKKHKRQLIKKLLRLYLDIEKNSPRAGVVKSIFNEKFNAQLYNDKIEKNTAWVIRKIKEFYDSLYMDQQKELYELLITLSSSRVLAKIAAAKIGLDSLFYSDVSADSVEGNLREIKYFSGWKIRINKEDNNKGLLVLVDSSGNTTYQCMYFNDKWLFTEKSYNIRHFLREKFNIEWGASSAIDSSTSSPAISLTKTLGGISFRGEIMDIKYETGGSSMGIDSKLPWLSQSELDKINIKSEIQQVKKMVSSGVSPSGKRVGELVAACEQKGEMSFYSSELLLFAMDNCKLSEINAQESSPDFISAFAFIDSRS